MNRLGADLPAFARLEDVDVDLCLEAVLGVRLGDEDDRPRRMPLRKTREHVVRCLDPLRRNPRGVRHHARSLVGHVFARREAQRCDLALDLADRR